MALPQIKFRLKSGDCDFIAKKLGVTTNYVSYVVHGDRASNTKTAKLIIKLSEILRDSRDEAETKIDELLKTELV